MHGISKSSDGSKFDPIKLCFSKISSKTLIDQNISRFNANVILISFSNRSRWVLFETAIICNIYMKSRKILIDQSLKFSMQKIPGKLCPTLYSRCFLIGVFFFKGVFFLKVVSFSSVFFLLGIFFASAKKFTSEFWVENKLPCHLTTWEYETSWNSLFWRKKTEIQKVDFFARTSHLKSKSKIIPKNQNFLFFLLSSFVWQL